MSRKRRTIPTISRYHRPVLTDVLPYETPPTFSNGGYFNFLTNYDVKIVQKGKQKWVVWESDTNQIDILIKLIFGPVTAPNQPPHIFQETVRGKLRSYRKFKILMKKAWSRPFNFDISHKTSEFRRLSVIHPKDQLAVASFYEQYSASIIYYTSLSEFSIRHPDKVATTSYFNDEFHQSKKGQPTDFIEEANKEYSNLGSYFSYSKFSNIFKFYEHYSYHNAEKKFGKMLKLDISKCFDSIYTHTADWCVVGKEAAKDNLHSFSDTYSNSFDCLMQNLNRGETNGIVIGPEFSRIFAETLLQAIDEKLVVSLQKDHDLKHRSDYRIFRYVDDYFVFYNEDVEAAQIQKKLSLLLREIKLNLNSAKSVTYARPIITAQTIAKDRIDTCISENLGSKIVEVPSSNPSVILKQKTVHFVNSKRLIVGFKTMLYETKISYSDCMNYTLALVEGKLDTLSKSYKNSEQQDQDPEQLAKVFVGALEFCFFIFSADPRVNFSIRLSRIITSMVDTLNDLKVHQDVKHQVFKYAHDNIVQQMDRSMGTKHTHIEVMYLLLALGKLGRKYCLPETSLAKYFGFNLTANSHSNLWPLDYFSIAVSLTYIKNRKKYSRFKNALEIEILKLFETKRFFLRTDSEAIITYLDLQACPFVSEGLKNQISIIVLNAMSPDAPQPITPQRLSSLRTQIELAVPYWFTNWQTYDLSIALDNKRAREVY